jgi:hypothetical protein
MKTSLRPHSAGTDLNHLRRGHTYRITTTAGVVHAGEYLGIEVVYGDWCLLMKGVEQTASIPTHQVDQIEISLQAA